MSDSGSFSAESITERRKNIRLLIEGWKTPPASPEPEMYAGDSDSSGSVDMDALRRGVAAIKLSQKPTVSTPEEHLEDSAGWSDVPPESLGSFDFYVESPVDVPANENIDNDSAPQNIVQCVWVSNAVI